VGEVEIEVAASQAGLAGRPVLKDQGGRIPVQMAAEHVAKHRPCRIEPPPAPGRHSGPALTLFGRQQC
jgi:hypothetical protein